MTRIPAGEKFFQEYYEAHPNDVAGIKITAVIMGIAVAIIGSLFGLKKILGN